MAKRKLTMELVIMRIHSMSRAASVLGIGLLTLAALALPPWTAAAETKDWVDRDHFPEAYSILTSDRVMFPDDVSDWPLKIDSSHQLFVDDYLISEIEGVTRQFHQPVKHPGNPLLPASYVAVLYDEGRRQFRMWTGPEYLTSADGVKWTKLDPGPQGNLMRSEGGELRGFLYNPDLPETEGRYKAVIERRWNEQAKEPGGFYLYHSRDGLNWERRPQRPILARTINCMKPCDFRPGGVGVPQEFRWEQPESFEGNGVGDTSTFRYDQVLKRYIFDGKFILFFPQEKVSELGIVPEKGKQHLRLRTFSESEDLIHWSPPRFLMYPDRNDPPDRQIYSHCGFVYESMWLGIIQAMRVRVTGWKQVDLRLSYSRDGRHWLRPAHREPFIPLGNAESWEADYSGTCHTAPVRVGEELFFYYFGSRNPARDKDPEKRWNTQIGVAKLRRDGFASLNAGETPGRVLTRPLTFAGKSLWINADVADGGWVKAALLSRDSKPIAGYSLEEATVLTKDTTRGQMRWNSKATLAPPGDDHLRVAFQLKNARLYSFWIE
jgi:hypothetical protein